MGLQIRIFAFPVISVEISHKEKSNVLCIDQLDLKRVPWTMCQMPDNDKSNALIVI